MEYNLREKFNLYAGPIVGAVAPIVAFKLIYSQDLSFSGPEGILGWSAALVSGVASLFSPAGAVTGMVIGKLEANQLARKRFERESALESQ